MCDTLSHGSDHLWLIWKESIQNCRCYRADTAGGTDGRTDGRTDRRTEWNQYTPQQLRCSGGITTRTPAFWGYPLPPHDYPYCWVILDPKSEEDKVKVTNLKISPKFQILKFWNKHYTRHTFWSCLIRCANMKWIRWVLLKVQSRHDSFHRRTDRQTDICIAHLI